MLRIPSTKHQINVRSDTFQRMIQMSAAHLVQWSPYHSHYELIYSVDERPESPVTCGFLLLFSLQLKENQHLFLILNDLFYRG